MYNETETGDRDAIGTYRDIPPTLNHVPSTNAGHLKKKHAPG